MPREIITLQVGQVRHPPELEKLSQSTLRGSQGAAAKQSLSMLRVPPAVWQPDRIRVLEEGAHFSSSYTLLQRSASRFLWRRMRHGHHKAERSAAVEALTRLLALCSSAWSMGSAMTASWKTLPLRQAATRVPHFRLPPLLPPASPSEWTTHQAHVRRGLLGGCREDISALAA